MGTPFMGELKLVAFNFAPKGWATADGQLLPINQNQALFSLMGTMYGGDGRTNFALPDLRGRIATHLGAGTVQGERGGEVAHTLSQAEIPPHFHQVMGTNGTANATPLPGGNVFANATLNAYAAPAPPSPIAPQSVSSTVGSQAHDNMAPYLVLTFCVALQGVFPSRN
jgi:microcystin-dependent protein